jgi:hypothetical protein
VPDLTSGFLRPVGQLSKGPINNHLIESSLSNSRQRRLETRLAHSMPEMVVRRTLRARYGHIFLVANTSANERRQTLWWTPSRGVSIRAFRARTHKSPNAIRCRISTFSIAPDCTIETIAKNNCQKLTMTGTSTTPKGETRAFMKPLEQVVAGAHRAESLLAAHSRLRSSTQYSGIFLYHAVCARGLEHGTEPPGLLDRVERPNLSTVEDTLLT